jgi:hypothetical protein
VGLVSAEILGYLLLVKRFPILRAAPAVPLVTRATGRAPAGPGSLAEANAAFGGGGSRVAVPVQERPDLDGPWTDPAAPDEPEESTHAHAEP